MNRTSAQDRAVSTTLGLIFLAFLVAFFISFILQNLLSLVSEKSFKSTELYINFLIAFGTLGFSLWFSRETVKEIVVNAIKEAADDDNKTMKDQLETMRLKIEQEYCCAIPLNIRSTYSQKVDILYSDICVERAARDGVIKALADEDELLKDIALTGTQLALNELKRDDVSLPDTEVFRDDIYAYLKAWLMFSIRYERNMPVEYIKQRYPQRLIPDNNAYVVALENIQNKVIVIQLEKHLDKRLNTTQKQLAVQITLQSLSKLINQLKKSKTI
ncbi:hypothetical protein I8751_09950 [Nostocaceae cyanobacterium CENA357]|uniref:Uncharacterized protein n=1 Tax=Atlanticothrix silvestris CENA357 TaxID=1725252 RepID=A0A8J7HCR0_9CYAN|nr:hypothetical protein [Atlanticothrix silvestris]MBH8552688.1 hypothetical protein [Atlanticothrix silvestris CENA357]